MGGEGEAGRSKKGQGKRSREERKGDEERDEKGEGGGEEGGKWRREEEGERDGRGKGKRQMMSFWCLTTHCLCDSTIADLGEFGCLSNNLLLQFCLCLLSLHHCLLLAGHKTRTTHIHVFSYVQWQHMHSFSPSHYVTKC